MDKLSAALLTIIVVGTVLMLCGIWTRSLDIRRLSRIQNDNQDAYEPDAQGRL